MRKPADDPSAVGAMVRRRIEMKMIGEEKYKEKGGEVGGK